VTTSKLALLKQNEQVHYNFTALSKKRKAQKASLAMSWLNIGESGGRWYKSGMSTRRIGLHRHLLALLFYSLLSLALTYPLVAQFGSHVPGDGIDDPALAWNLWWIKHSLVDQQINPFLSGWMFYPLGINLAFYTLTVLNGLLSVPLQVALGLVPASNLVLLSSFVLSGYGAYLLALQVVGGGGISQRMKNNEWRADGSSFIVHRSRSPGGSEARSGSLIVFLSAFLAGLVYAFSSSKLFYGALGQFNIASSQWIPFTVLYVLRSGRPGARLREPLLAALFLLLQAYAELTYASFLVIFIAVFAGYRVGQIVMKERREKREGGGGQGRQELVGLVRNLAVMAVVFVVGLAPVLANMLPDMRAEGDFLVEGGGFADIFSADLAGFALPTQLHPLLGDVVRGLADDSALRPDGSQWQVDKGQHLTLGIAGLALALLGLVVGRRRGAWLWALSTGLFFLLALGPSLRIAGYDTGLPGPFRILQELPFFKGNRYPSRFSVMLLISVAPLLAFGAHWLLARLAAGWQRRHDARGVRRRLAAATALLASLLILENLSIPLPTANMATPAIYDVIAAEPAGGAVLDLPLGWRNGFNVFGKQDLIIMSQQWWQTRHGQPILGGNTSRNPEHKFRYFLEAPLIGPLTVLANATDANPHIQQQMADGLAALRDGDPALGGNDLLLAAAADGPAVLQALDIGYVVVHTDRVPPEFVTFVERYLPVSLVAEEGPHHLYRVELTAPPAKVTVAPATDALSRSEGWSGLGQAQVEPTAADESSALWAQRRETRLLLPPVQPGADRITVAAAAAGPGQTLSLRVDGVDTAPQPLPETWSELTFDLPAGVLSEQVNDVRLRFGQTYPVAALDVAPGLLVESAGLEAGNYAHIWFDGVNLAPNKRGYNLAIIDSATWQPRAVAAFDTHADPAASAALVEFLGQMDDDSVLAVAVRDTASDQLSAEAAQALAAWGLSDLRGRLRWSQAAIVLGANVASGQRQVVEQIDGLQAASAGYGPGWREPQAAAEVLWVRAESALPLSPVP
jgi:hypothetical protein